MKDYFVLLARITMVTTQVIIRHLDRALFMTGKYLPFGFICGLKPSKNDKFLNR